MPTGAQGEHGTTREGREPEGTAVTFPPTVSAIMHLEDGGFLGTNRQVVRVRLPSLSQGTGVGTGTGTGTGVPTRACL